MTTLNVRVEVPQGAVIKGLVDRLYAACDTGNQRSAFGALNALSRATQEGKYSEAELREDAKHFQLTFKV